MNEMNPMEMANKIKQEKFVMNNGRILRAINMLRIKYVPLSDLRLGLPSDITDGEYTDSINYLTEIGYINIRRRGTKEETTLADAELHELEAKLSANGIKFLAGRISDNCVGR